MFANLFLAIFCVSTILLYGIVRKQSKRIRRIEKTSIEPDKRIDKHGKKIKELEVEKEMAPPVEMREEEPAPEFEAGPVPESEVVKEP